MSRKHSKHNEATLRVVLTPQDDGGYLVEVPSLPGCATYGKSVEDALQNAKEAILSYIGSLEMDGERIPDDSSRPVESVVAPAVQSMIPAGGMALA